MTFTGFTANGQLVAAVAALVDAIFFVLYVLGVIHTRPEEGIVVGIVTVAFNVSTAVLAYIQHSQATTKATMAHEMAMRGL